MISIVFTLVATISYGIIFQVPPKALAGAGAVGIIGWLIKNQVITFGYPQPSGILLASVSVAVLSQLLSRTYRVPSTVFIISGIIPLVPGFLAYTTMRHLMEYNFIEGLASGMETAISAGAIATGLVIGESMVRLMKGRKRRHVG